MNWLPSPRPTFCDPSPGATEPQVPPEPLSASPVSVPFPAPAPSSMVPLPAPTVSSTSTVSSAVSSSAAPPGAAFSGAASPPATASSPPPPPPEAAPQTKSQLPPASSVTSCALHCPVPSGCSTQQPDAQSAAEAHWPVMNCWPFPSPTFSEPESPVAAEQSAWRLRVWGRARERPAETMGY